jgi:hypothetical protein
MGSFNSCRWRLPVPNEEEIEQLNKMNIKIDDRGYIILPFGYDIGTRLDVSGYYFIYG